MRTLPSVPFKPLFEVMDEAMTSLNVSGMKSVDHEDSDYNDDYSVDPLSDPRLDKMDLFNLVDTKDRDKIMSAHASVDCIPDDSDPTFTPDVEPSSGSGGGE